MNQTGINAIETFSKIKIKVAFRLKNAIRKMEVFFESDQKILLIQSLPSLP